MMHQAQDDIQRANGIRDDAAALAQLSRRVEFLALLQEFDIELNHTLELASVLQIALRAAQLVSHADGGWIALLENDELKLRSGFGAYAERAVTAITGIPARALRWERAEYVPDTTADVDYVAELPATRAQISVPLLAHFKIVGLLNVETDSPNRFTPDVFEFTTMLAGRVASAIENARLYQTSQAQLAELGALYKEVSALEQLKTDMIRVAAHDIRSPLAIVKSYVELLADDLAAHLTDYHHNTFRAISKAVGRIERMSSDILTLERLGANAAPPDDIVALSMLLESAVDDLYDDSRVKDQQITLLLPREPVYVTGDQAQLREALHNLLSNAIKYTDEGGCIVARLSAGDGYALVEIEDNGYGVPENDQTRLFEPFFRSRTQETRGIEGTGLGLYLVKQIVERHGGTVEWRSVYRSGSTFGFRLPLLGSA